MCACENESVRASECVCVCVGPCTFFLFVGYIVWLWVGGRGVGG